jgi:hypothetical protein
VDELELQLSDAVLFELPTFEAAQAFRVRLRSRWAGWSHDDDPVWLFAAELRDEADDLAQLLREAQELLADLDLPAIVFVLDGRTYVLDPAEPVYERADRPKQAA